MNINVKTALKLRPSCLAVAFLFLCFTACDASDTLTGTIEPETGEGTTQVGTTTGNPYVPVADSKNLISFATIDAGLDSSQDSSFYCRPLNHKKYTTQACAMTPENFSMGVLGVYLVECLDANNAAVICASPEARSIAKKTEVYRGDKVEIKVNSNQEVYWPFPLAITDNGDFVAGGIQFILAHMTYGIPDAENIDENIRGIDSRICMSPQQPTSQAEMLALCGNATAWRGDFIFDPDKDEAFSYFLLNDFVDVRPQHYTRIMGTSDIARGRSHYSNGLLSAENPEYVDGYFAPIFSLSTTQAVVDSNYKVVFDLTDVLSFVDGWGATTRSNGIVCVQALSSKECLKDSDPTTVGEYSFVYDGALIPMLPHVDIEVSVTK